MSISKTISKTMPGALNPDRLRRKCLGCGSACLLVLGLAMGSSGLAAQAVHQHGHAALTMAVDGAQLEISFDSPADNLLGFEYAARTEAQKQLVAQARQQLMQVALMRPEQGQCQLLSAEVEIASETNEAHEGEHEKAHGESDADTAQHADIEVVQRFTCDADALGGGWRAEVMKQYPDVQQLAVSWVSGTGQGSVRLVSAQQVFKLTND